MSRRRAAARFALSPSARQRIDVIMATARDQVETVLQREVSRLVADAQDSARQEAFRCRPAHPQAIAAATHPQPIYVRPVRAQQLFGVHRATLYRWAKDGHITIHKRGSTSFIHVDELRAFIEGNQP